MKFQLIWMIQILKVRLTAEGKYAEKFSWIWVISTIILCNSDETKSLQVKGTNERLPMSIHVANKLLRRFEDLQYYAVIHNVNSQT